MQNDERDAIEVIGITSGRCGVVAGGRDFAHYIDVLAFCQRFFASNTIFC